jgi:hypothetical protein
MSVDEFGSTADALMSVFHGLSAGKGRRPLSETGFVVVPPPVDFFGSGSDGAEDAESVVELQEASRALAATATKKIRMTICCWSENAAPSAAGYNLSAV